jgi:Transcription-silencing protein Clr2
MRSPEQNLDAEPNGKYLYRPGELVWFNKGAAWGLAVICKRQIINSIPRYLLQPLSHPLRHCSSLIKTQDLIRPWLAWSVPNTTHPQISNLAYDQVPWERVVKGELGAGDPEVDGSILAAKAIDGSYTLFDRLDIPTAAPGEVYYSGMFLGAEKIWVGEPIRMRGANDDVVVMVIQQMIERTAATGSIVTLVGDIYKFVEMPTPYKDRSEWPTPKLPPRMVADLYFRNEVSNNAKKGVWYEWRLLEPMARKQLTEVKGRWYETRALLPILRGVEFQNDIAKGITSDAGVFMNARGDSSNRPGQRKRNRLDTLGRAVPQDLKISRGLNGSPADDTFPDEHQDIQSTRRPANLGQFGSTGGATVGDLDQFMNLDHGTENQDFYGNTMQH